MIIKNIIFNIIIIINTIPNHMKQRGIHRKIFNERSHIINKYFCIDFIVQEDTTFFE